MRASRIVPLVLLALLALAPVLLSAFYLTLMNYVGLFSIVALGLVLLTGVAGLTSFGQAAFCGLGAYATAVLTTQYGISPWLALIAALCITGVVALFIGTITLRLGGHYLPLATIAWGISLYYLFGTLPGLGQFTGIADLPALTLFGFPLKSERTYYYLIWGATLLSLLLTHNLLTSQPGRIVQALAGTASMAQAFGANTARVKMQVFLYAALLSCLSGWLYAHLQRYVNPTPFSVTAGIEYLFMAVIGGAGGVWGAVIGAAVITFLKQVLQDVLPALLGRSGQFESIVFGALIVVMLHRARMGLWPLLRTVLPKPERQPLAEPLDIPQRPRREHGEGKLDGQHTDTVLLDVRNLSKNFDGLPAVQDISFQVRVGEIVGLIGPNGAGKTTTFNLISGALPATSGEVELNGHIISKLEPFEIAEYGLARTFQHVKLVPDLTVLDNVMLGAWLRRKDGFVRSCLRLERKNETLSRREATRQIERVGLLDHIDVLAGSLPLGHQRLVEIARALMANPLLLLLDEPAAALRHLEQERLFALLEQLRTEKMTVLLVEHDMDFVMRLADRIVVMESGQKIAEGLPDAIQRNERVQNSYLGCAA
ncbi:branched-chain amino acid ABC transporter ATP-binding protein/permease [Telmatospirillum sp.]|uniref:branched-chain amino acid ABC transporter ATP-binding protein/permease n=1 Tax=Telmatospirillum sp. TaxID=2079197 RepID=UPI00283AD20F|nr:branched-chain amino acid ABC transporter ATP-binding protein/permease [Telmatospirillum sp.]MDR3437842.1 branched-chain amino acid ABC transporter ATP-binding protein/permease [Telmatospirillum sp.]